MTTSCKFNLETCKSNCSNFTMCSLLNTEKHINALENQITNIFSSLNQIINFTSNTGSEILEIKKIIPEKDDIISQFNMVYDELNGLKELVINGNNEVKNIILQYSNELKNVLDRISVIEKAILPE